MQGGGGHNLIIFFIELFHVLDYLDQFKAIKENLLRGVGHLYPLRIPTYLRLSQKPKFVVFLFFFEGFPKQTQLVCLEKESFKKNAKSVDTEIDI